MKDKIIKKVIKKIKKDNNIMQMLYNSSLKTKPIFSGIARHASAYALDLIADKMVKDSAFAATITETSHLEYTELALNEIRKELLL